MNKPFTMVYEEFKQELANIINNCGLPAPAIESVLQNYIYEIRDVVKNQYQIDKSQYEKSLVEKKDKKKQD